MTVIKIVKVFIVQIFFLYPIDCLSLGSRYFVGTLIFEISSMSILFVQQTLVFYYHMEKMFTIHFMLNRLHWFGHVQRLEENRIPKRVLYMNLGTRLTSYQ